MAKYFVEHFVTKLDVKEVEVKDEEDIDLLRERIAQWVVDCTQIPESAVDSHMLDGLVAEYLWDSGMMCDGRAESLNDEYLALMRTYEKAEPIPIDIIEGL